MSRAVWMTEDEEVALYNACVLAEACARRPADHAAARKAVTIALKLKLPYRHSTDEGSPPAVLRPCPFCGGTAEFERRGTPRMSCIVVCSDCGARLESGDVGEASGTSWNRRAP